MAERMEALKENLSQSKDMEKQRSQSRELIAIQSQIRFLSFAHDEHTIEGMISCRGDIAKLGEQWTELNNIYLAEKRKKKVIKCLPLLNPCHMVAPTINFLCMSHFVTWSHKLSVHVLMCDMACRAKLQRTNCNRGKWFWIIFNRR